MTREERLDWLCRLRSFLTQCGMPNKWRANFNQALSDEIEVLESKPCEDAISRQAVLDIDFRRIILTTAKPAEMIEQKVKTLPSVNPQPKIGHWIYTGDYLTEGMLKCSECGAEIDVSESYYDFCPNCGAKMVETQESEGNV